MGEWEIVKFTTRFASIRLMKQEDFFVAIALFFFVENCLDLLQCYLRNEDISKALVIFFPKINQFTRDKIFVTFAHMGQAFMQAVLLMSVFEQRLNVRKL